VRLMQFSGIAYGGEIDFRLSKRIVWTSFFLFPSPNVYTNAPLGCMLLRANRGPFSNNAAGEEDDCSFEKKQSRGGGRNQIKSSYK
jgi:hypothetical protein